jgi:transposase
MRPSPQPNDHRAATEVPRNSGHPRAAAPCGGRLIHTSELRDLCTTAATGGHRHEISARRWAFYDWCAAADIPEITTLAETIETWWPAVEVFLTTGLTNARTEGTNRLTKQIKRSACGFRNRANYRRRVRLHCTRHSRRMLARNRPMPA